VQLQKIEENATQAIYITTTEQYIQVILIEYAI